MKVAIRVDATVAIGTGHLGRCLTLARALHARGDEILFISRAMPELLRANLLAAGFTAEFLPARDRQPGTGAHAHWLEADGDRDAADTLNAIRARFSGPVDWLIVDHYALDAVWHAAVRAATGRILVVDDLADRALDCDLLLDQTFGREAATYLPQLRGNPTLLLGSRYALLREEFAVLRPTALSRRQRARPGRVLVSFGGIDQQNMTMTALDVLAQSPEMQAVDIVLGGSAPHRVRVEERLRAFPVPAALHVDTPHVAGLMLQADVAIGACGFSSWERCCLGLPTIGFATAANQEWAARQLERCGAIHLLPAQGADVPGELRRGVANLMQQPDRYARMVDAAARVCDGAGTARVVAAIDGVPA